MAPASAANALVPTLPNRSRAPAKKPFKPVKTATCWLVPPPSPVIFQLTLDRFWETPNKECRNFHAFLPTRLGEPTNLHTSKPVWGAPIASQPSPSTPHTYDFGGLKFLVRSEGDGYLKQTADLEAQPNDAETANTSVAPLESNESLAKAQEESESR